MALWPLYYTSRAHHFGSLSFNMSKLEHFPRAASSELVDDGSSISMFGGTRKMRYHRNIRNNNGNHASKDNSNCYRNSLIDHHKSDAACRCTLQTAALLSLGQWWQLMSLQPPEGYPRADTPNYPLLHPKYLHSEP